MKLSETIVDNFDKIIKHFNLELRPYNKGYQGPCPIHNGDNNTGVFLYTTGNTQVGVWRCFTGDCHTKYGANAIGFIRGLLEKQRKCTVKVSDAISWCEDFFKCKIDISPDTEDEILTKVIARYSREAPKPPFRLTKEQFKDRLETPDYFIKRGYKEETLEKFLVGACNDRSKPMYNRIIVPHFDNEGKYIIGALGRSKFDKCTICGAFHDPQSYCKPFPKWKNTTNFPSEWSLYNFHRAESYINKTGIVILIESAGDTWRIDEAEFPMACGCFGSKFSEAQKRLLDRTMCNTVIVVPNAGQPGQILVNHVKEQCKLTHNIVIIEPSYQDDIGACNINTVKKILGPYIDKNLR